MANERFVLVVDDDINTITIISLYMGALKYPFKSALNAEQGLEIIRANPQQVGLLLLDLAMPGMSGQELARAIRADSALAHIPIVVLTATAEPHEINDAFDAGVNEVLLKPFLRNDLQHIIETYF